MALLLILPFSTPWAQESPQAPAPPAAPDLPEQPDAPLPPAPPLPDRAPRPPDPGDFDDIFDARGESEVLRIGQSLNVPAGDAIREAVVIFGDVTVAGQVDNELVVILGSVRLASTARIGGDFVAIGGNVDVEPGAVVQRDAVVVGGSFDAPADFMAGGEHVIVPWFLGEWVDGFVPYFSRGLLWGRLIVPDLPWVWGVVAFFFLGYLVLTLALNRPVRACADVVQARPLTAFGVGLLVLLLVGPVSLLLAVSVVGIVVVPFVCLALVAGWVVGKVGVARAMGMGILPEIADTRAYATRSLLIGFVLITLAYMVPVLGIITWAIVGVLGLGAASLAFFAAYRRENPRPAPVAAAVPPPPVPTPYTPPAEATPVAPPASASAFSGATAPPTVAYQTATGLGGGAAAAAIPLGAPAPAVLAAMPRALFRDRLAAFVLDVILVLMTVNVFDFFNEEDVFFPFLLLYHIGFWTWKQTTVGGIICQIRLVRTDGAPLGFADALVRGLASIFSLAVFFIGALWILRDPERQAWHDKIAGTYVVKVPRNWPL